MKNVLRLSLRSLMSISCLAVGAQWAAAATIGTTTNVPSPGGLNSLVANNDLIQGMSGTDLGGLWFQGSVPARTSLTDGIGYVGTGIGTPKDSPGDGVPAASIGYSLGGAFDIEKVRIFSDWGDTRTMSTTVVHFSTDFGANYSVLGYFQSYPSGTSGIVDATLVEIADDQGDMIGMGVTDIIFDLYAGSDSAVALDPFSGVNPFTGADDTGVPAIVSPVLNEIDVIGTATIPEPTSFALVGLGAIGLFTFRRGAKFGS